MLSLGQKCRSSPPTGPFALRYKFGISLEIPNGLFLTPCHGHTAHIEIRKKTARLGRPIKLNLLSKHTSAESPRAPT